MNYPKIKSEKVKKSIRKILERHACLFEGKVKFPKKDEIRKLICIPVLADQEIFENLNSILEQKDENTKILILVNEPENSPENITKENKQIFKKLSRIEEVHVSYIKFPEKIAGVGLARRVLMDEAVCIATEGGKKTEEGVIISLDADTSVEGKWLSEIQKFYEKNRGDVGICYFEHRFSPDVEKEGVLWELFLRYWKNSLTIFGYPYFYPIGSTITCKVSVYALSGGMNTRQAGEDFYFVSKLIPAFRTRYIRAKVFPKARVSERTPFGTGKAIAQSLRGERKLSEIWKFECFEEVGKIIKEVKEVESEKDIRKIPGKLPESFLKFISSSRNLKESFSNLVERSGEVKTFKKNFITFFNPFRVFKFVNFLSSQKGLGGIEIETQKLIQKITQRYNLSQKRHNLSQKYNLSQKQNPTEQKENSPEKAREQLEFLRCIDFNFPQDKFDDLCIP